MAEECAEVSKGKGPTHLSTLGPLFGGILHRLRLCCRPGVFLLMGTLVPHGLYVPLNLIFRSYFHLLRFEQAFFTAVVQANQLAAIVGALSFLVALRVVLRPRKAGESKWDLNRCAATLALVVFAASAVHSPARSVYYEATQSSARLQRLAGENTMNRLYRLHDRFERFSGGNPEKYYPALSRMDKRFPVILPEAHWRFEHDISTPGLPLRVVFEGRSYYYLGYRVRDDKEIGDFAQAYLEAFANTDLPELLSLESAGLARLGEYPIASRVPGLPLPKGAWSGIPLLIEAIDPEKDTEGYVLFCNGRTEQVTYPGHWPMTEATITQLRALIDESLRLDGGDLVQ